MVKLSVRVFLYECNILGGDVGGRESFWDVDWAGERARESTRHVE